MPPLRQHRGRRHEPQPGDIIVDPLRVGRVVGISGGDAREQVLVAFARQQIAVAQRVLAELGQQRIAAVVGGDVESGASTVLLVRIGRDVVARNFRLARKIHFASPSFYSPFEDRLFPNCSNSEPCRHPSLFCAPQGLFSPSSPISTSRGRGREPVTGI